MTQRSEVLRMLRLAPGRKVSSEQFLAAGIPRYSARIFELRADGHRIAMTPAKGKRTVVFELVFDCERDVESSRRGILDPGAVSSSAAAALSVTDGVEGDCGTARVTVSQRKLEANAAVPLSAGHGPMNPYEYDLLGEAA